MANGKCDYPLCQQANAPNWPDTPQRFCTEHIETLFKAMLTQKPEVISGWWADAAGGKENIATIQRTAAVLQAALTLRLIEDGARMVRGTHAADEWEI